MDGRGCQGPSAARTLGKHAGPVMALAYHPNGSSVTSVGEDGSVYLWNFSARRETLFGDREGRVSAVAYSPDGQYLAAGIVGADGSTVSLLDLESGEPRLELRAADAWITALAYSPDGAADRRRLQGRHGQGLERRAAADQPARVRDHRATSPRRSDAATTS